jgi:hypothetical protein
MVLGRGTGARPMYWVLIGLAVLCASLGYAGYFALYPRAESRPDLVGLLLPLCFFLLGLFSVVLAKVVRGLDAVAGEVERRGRERAASPPHDSGRPPA